VGPTVKLADFSRSCAIKNGLFLLNTVRAERFAINGPFDDYIHSRVAIPNRLSCYRVISHETVAKTAIKGVVAMPRFDDCGIISFG